MIKPIGKRVLIKKITEKSEGIEYAEINASEFTEGEVVALSELYIKYSKHLDDNGTGIHNILKLGDIVIISKYAGEQYLHKDGDDLYKIVEVKHIVAVK